MDHSFSGVMLRGSGFPGIWMIPAHEIYKDLDFKIPVGKMETAMIDIFAE